jgi:hypothetical protein
MQTCCYTWGTAALPACPCCRPTSTAAMPRPGLQCPSSCGGMPWALSSCSCTQRALRWGRQLCMLPCEAPKKVLSLQLLDGVRVVLGPALSAAAFVAEQHAHSHTHAVVQLVEGVTRPRPPALLSCRPGTHATHPSSSSAARRGQCGVAAARTPPTPWWKKGMRWIWHEPGWRCWGVGTLTC